MTALELARMTCGECGGPVTLEDPLDGGDPCVTCRPCGFLLAHVAERLHGWVDPGDRWVHDGVRALRPAYRDGPHGPVTYSPPGAGAWVDAPDDIAATWVVQHGRTFAPFMVPAGYRIMS